MFFGFWDEYCPNYLSQPLENQNLGNNCLKNLSQTAQFKQFGMKLMIQDLKDLLFAFAVHPALVVIPSSVFFRCKACALLEHLNEVGLR